MNPLANLACHNSDDCSLRNSSMASHPTHPEVATLYDRNIALWANLTTELLRPGQFECLDVDHLINEVIDLGHRGCDRLVSAVRLILHYELK